MWYKRYIQNEAEIQAIFVAFTTIEIHFVYFYVFMNSATRKSEMLKKILW